MKSFICIVTILLLAAQSNAETYSWVDDSGTYNFTEDYSSVPKKYRKKVKQRDDVPQDAAPQASLNSEKPLRHIEKTEGTSAGAVGSDKELYGGKSRSEWRKMLEAQEAEMGGVAQRMEEMRKQISEPKGLSKAQIELLKKYYEGNRTIYDQKYKSYTELIETIRKAGITVEMRK